MYFEGFASKCLLFAYARFVNAHLTAHTKNLQQRIDNYHYIVNSLLFPPLPSSSSPSPSTIYSTSHLFFFGDLNFRLTSIPEDPAIPPQEHINALLHNDDSRRVLSVLDQLVIERDTKKTVFEGLREGEFWKFKCTYKYKLGEVDKYECVI